MRLTRLPQSLLRGRSPTNRVARAPRRRWTWALHAAVALAVVCCAGCAPTKSASSSGDYSYSFPQEAPAGPLQLSAGRSRTPDYGSGLGEEARAEATDESPPAPERAALGGEPGKSSANVNFEAAASKVRQPLLIYTAVLRLAVYRADPGLAQAEKIALDAGGYLVRRDNTSIVVRVPAARFKEVLRAMEQLGDVVGRDIQAQDVTDEFFDVDTRLRNARAMRDRLQLLLERANNVEEALKVEEELGRITGEIERLEGRLKLLRELLAFSSVTVEFRARPTEVVTSRVKLPFRWLDELGLGRLLDLGGHK